MIPDVSFPFETGVKRFSSTKELRLFLKNLLDSYEKARDKMDFITAEMLRGGDAPEVAQSKGWFKVDELFLNKSDQTRAGLDILFQIMRESKPRIRLVEASLKAFEKFDGLGIPDDTAVLLYLRDGIPSRIVIGGDVGTEAPKGGPTPPQR